MAVLQTSELQVENEHCAGECSACTSVGSCSSRMVCRCLKVVEDTIIDAIRDGGACTVGELKQLTGAGKGCMACQGQLKRYLTVYASTSSPSMCCAR